MAFKTEFEFTLPKGFVDEQGNLHRKGVMRLATAKDEIIPLQDFRVKNNRAYLVIILLSRVIVRLGDLKEGELNPSVVEGLFSADLSYLQEFYRQINESGTANVGAKCPSCGQEFQVDIGTGATALGGIVSYPLDKLSGEVAYIAYHFHWGMDDILEMEHKERHMWIKEISEINKRINEASKGSGGGESSF